VTAAVPTRRPGVVTFIGVILYIQGFLAAVAAVSMLIWRNDILDYLEKEGSPLADGAFTPAATCTAPCSRCSSESSSCGRSTATTSRIGTSRATAETPPLEHTSATTCEHAES